MLAFYLYQRVVAANPESFIWGHAYFEPGWQAFFDVFNSLPLIGVAGLIAWRAGSAVWLALFASMALHCLADLPLHNEDAHAHFFPLSTWHFRSPVSYWDPRHYGLVSAAAEALFVAGGALALMRRRGSRPWRVMGAVTLGLYLVLGVFALSVWVGHS